MDPQDLAYAVVQVAHNFGAATVTGSAAFALWPSDQPQRLQRRLAWLLLAGWAVQAASGAALGVVSFVYHGEFPDIHGIALGALTLKAACAVSGFLAAALYLRAERRWDTRRRRRVWRLQAGLGATALTAAAFLRWFA